MSLNVILVVENVFLNQKCNNDKYWYKSKNPREHRVSKKNYIQNPATCTCKNVKYLGSFIDELIITCDEIINDAGSVLTNVMSTRSNLKIVLAY